MDTTKYVLHCRQSSKRTSQETGVHLNRVKRSGLSVVRPCQGGLPGRLSEFQNVPCRHFLIVLSEVGVAVGYTFNSTAVCRYFI